MFPGYRKKRDKTKRTDSFLENGTAVLEQVIRTVNGDCNPIRSYSAEELKKATGDFQWEIYKDDNHSMYEGTQENCKICVKKMHFWDLESTWHEYNSRRKAVANEIAIASRMSNHKSVLKLLGCCLETELPILVYQFPAMGNLDNCIKNGEDRRAVLTWDQKLRIVNRAANAVAYLHHGLPKTFIHRNLKMRNIYLDGNLFPKLHGFQDAMPIPEGKTYVDADPKKAIMGFVAPEVFWSSRYTEKSDVYAFGALMFEVVTEKTYVYIRRHHYEVSARSGSNSTFQLDAFWEEVVAEHCKVYQQDENIRVQLREYAKLMQRCLEDNPDDRPT